MVFSWFMRILMFLAVEYGFACVSYLTVRYREHDGNTVSCDRVRRLVFTFWIIVTLVAIVTIVEVLSTVSTLTIIVATIEVLLWIGTILDFLKG